MKSPTILLLIVLFFGCKAQPYTVANAHSHNDYRQAVPFFTAYKAEFGSIEADIFLEQGDLYVAHDTVELKKRRSLDSLYLIPLQQGILKNGGTVYPETARELLLLIDIKTDSIETLKALVTKLSGYPSLIHNRTLHFVITGNRPDPADFGSWPEWLSFDGDLDKRYSSDQLSRIALFSANFATYAKWKGVGELPASDLRQLTSQIAHAHDRNKKIRFWNAPDMPQAWQELIHLQADYLNTDHIASLKSFLESNAAGSGK